MVNDSRSTQYNQDLPWSLVTKRVSGVLWGYLSGLACPLHTLAKAWTEPYREIIALDHDPCLLDSPEYGVLNVPFGKRQHAQTLWLLEKIPASGAPDVPAGVQNTVGDWDIWTFWHWTRHARTQSSGPALLAPLGYMCVDGQRFWSEALRSNPHRDMLVGGREEWQKVEGLFA